MPSSIGTPTTAGPRPAGLVAVDGRTYPLEAVRVEGRAEGGIASTTLIQTYANPYDEPLEVLYTLPLPADGAVLGYAIHFGERVIRGEVMKREEAAKAYEDAMFEGRLAGLLEQDRDDTFTQRLGSLPGRQTARIEIQMLHPLAFVPVLNGGPARWEYRFPTVVGVRYEGAPGRVPDAGRLDVDRDAAGGIPTRAEVDLVIADGIPEALAAGSETHDIVCQAQEGATRVALREGARLDRDLVVRWNAGADEAGVRLIEGSGLPGDKARYGLLTLTPPTLPGRAFTRDVTLLLDSSGSMSGAPLAWAKRVIAGLLASLEPEDSFELLAFANDVKRITASPVPGTEKAIDRVLSALEGLEAAGGTEMASALIKALEPLRADSQRQVVLITDGYIGFESEIVGEILRRLPAGARVHAVGVGAAPNRALLRGVARAGRGMEVIVSAESEVAEAAGRLRRATARPVLTEVAVTGTAVRASVPERPRDVMVGHPLVLALELAAEGGTIEVHAQQAGAADRWAWRVTVPAAGQGTAATPIAIGALFGRETIADLELRAAASSGRNETFDRAIEAAGLRHRIASRLTSLVAFAEEPTVDPLQPRRRERLPVEMPQGVSIEGTGMQVYGAPEAARYLVASKLSALNPVGWAWRALRDHRARSRTAAISDQPLVPLTPVCRVLRHEGREIVIEFEVPENGVDVPSAFISGTGGQGEPVRFEVMSERSTAGGPFRKGMIVRLALEIPPDQHWPVSSPVTLSYRTHAQIGKGAQPMATVELRFELPSPTATRDAC